MTMKCALIAAAASFVLLLGLHEPAPVDADAGTPPQTPAPAAAAQPLADVRLRLHGAIPQIEVRIDGEGPFLAVIDSGSTDCVISPRLAQRFHLNSAPGAPVVDAYGQSYSSQAVTLDSIDIGGASLTNCTARVGVLGSYDAVIGAALFQRYVVTLDFKNKRCRLFDPPAYTPDPNLQRLDIAVQPVSNMGVFPGAIDGIAANMAFDSGSAPFLRITGGPVADAVRQQETASNSFRTESYSGRKIADNYTVRILTIGKSNFRLATRFKATIPHNGALVADDLPAFVSLAPFLGSSITFDYPAQLILFDRPPAQ